MLEAVGHPFAVNPDHDLRRIARERGWPILVFDKPVALRSRVRFPPVTPTLAVLTVGRLAALGAALWLGVRTAPRRRPEKSSLVDARWPPAYKGGTTPQTTHGAGTHAAIYPSTGRWSHPDLSGGHS